MEGLLNVIHWPTFIQHAPCLRFTAFVCVDVCPCVYLQNLHFALLCFLFSTKELSAISVEEMAETDVLLACNN